MAESKISKTDCIGKRMEIGEKSEVLIITNESEIFLFQDGEGRLSLRYGRLSEEETYRMVPAQDLFGGRFTEVRNLHDKLANVVKIELAVITKGYGLIGGKTLISPYMGYVSTVQDIHEMEERFSVCEKVGKMIEGCDMVVFCLPKNILSFFIEKELFSKNANIVFITTRDLAVRLQNDSFIILPRKGARVGRDNAQYLMQICEKHSSFVL